MHLSRYYAGSPAPAQKLREIVKREKCAKWYSVDIPRNLFLNWLIKNLNVKFPECNIICIFRAIKHQIKYQSMQSKNFSKKYKERLLKCNITSGGLSSGVSERGACGVMSEPEGGPGRPVRPRPPGRLRVSLLSCWQTLDFPWKSRGEKTRESSESGLNLGRRYFSLPSELCLGWIRQGSAVYSAITFPGLLRRLMFVTMTNTRPFFLECYFVRSANAGFWIDTVTRMEPFYVCSNVWRKVWVKQNIHFPRLQNPRPLESISLFISYCTDKDKRLLQHSKHLRN